MAYKNTALVDVPFQKSRRTLIPKIGMSYTTNTDLKRIVDYINDWQFETGIYTLDEVIEEAPFPADALLLKGEVLALAEQNYEAIAIYSKVLEIEPDNVYALTGKLIQLNRVRADEKLISAVSKRLRALAPEVYTKYAEVISLKTDHQNDFNRRCISDTIDALLVFGYFLNADGTVPEKLQQRLTKVIELADRYPEASIVISGGPVQNHFSEAREMKRYLVDAGVEEERLFAYERARDTAGNIMEFLDFVMENPINEVCAVTSKDHLPRTWMSLVTGFKQAGLDVHVHGESPEDDIDGQIIEREHNLNYQTLFRLAGLFEKKDIMKLI